VLTVVACQRLWRC